MLSSGTNTGSAPSATLEANALLLASRRVRHAVADGGRATLAGVSTGTLSVATLIPTKAPVSATTLARSVLGADVPMPNVLSTRHLARIGAGLLFAATSSVPWATLLPRTFEVDVKSCPRCGGSLEVRAVVTGHDIARKILDAIPTAARAPPVADSTVVYEPAFA